MTSAMSVCRKLLGSLDVFVMKERAVGDEYSTTDVFLENLVKVTHSLNIFLVSEYHLLKILERGNLSICLHMIFYCKIITRKRLASKVQLRELKFLSKLISTQNANANVNTFIVREIWLTKAF